MNYQDFLECVQTDLMDKLPESLKEVWVDDVSGRLNEIDMRESGEEVLEGILIRPKGSRFTFAMNLEPFYLNWRFGVDYGTILAQIVRMVELKIRALPNVTLQPPYHYENMKKKLFVQLVPKEGNEEMLSLSPHRDLEDMALVYYLRMREEGCLEEAALFTNEMLSQCGIEAEQLHRDALENSERIVPFVIRDVAEVLADEFGTVVWPQPEDKKMYVAGIKNMLWGASVITYPSFMDAAAKKLGGDFFVLMGVVHEAILLPDKGAVSLSDMNETINEVREEESDPADRLSRYVYHYDSREKVFERAEKFVERKRKQKAENESARKKSGEIKKTPSKSNAAKKKADRGREQER